MNTERTVFDQYELRDLSTGRSWYFEDLYEARAAVTALELREWVIVSGRSNVVERSHVEATLEVVWDEDSAEGFDRLWEAMFGVPRTPMVDMRKHPPYAAVLKALDDLPLGLAMNLINVWATEHDLRDTKHGVRSELAEMLTEDEPDYWVRAHDLPPKVPTKRVLERPDRTGDING